MQSLTPLSLYIINNVKLRRLILGISAIKLSKLLRHSESYVSEIESILSPSQYPTHEWPKLAEVLACTVHDLLPSGESEDNSVGRLVDKIVIDLAEENDMTLVVNRLIDVGHFKTPRTLAEVVDHLSIKDRGRSVLLRRVLLASKALKADDDNYYQ